MAVGLPRPLYDGLPVPYTARVDQKVDEDGVFVPFPNFADIDVRRMEECITGFGCLVCGAELQGDVALIVRGEDPFEEPEIREGGAFCVRCAKLAVAHCPVLRMPGAGKIMVGPLADLTLEQGVGEIKIITCPESFRPLERTVRAAGRAPMDACLV
jgi:hypothetical protein